MRRFVLFAAVGLIAAPVLGDGLMKYRGIRHYTYNYQTGELKRVDDQNTRPFNIVWDISTGTGYFFGSGAGNMNGNWGDIDPTIGDITQFRVGYATNSVWVDPNNTPGPIGTEMVFYDNDFGQGDQVLALTPGGEFDIQGMPGVPDDANLPNNIGLGFEVEVTDITPFSLTANGADEDVDGASATGSVDPNNVRYDPLWHGCVDDAVNGFGGFYDFGYTYLFRTPGNRVTGPLLVQPGEPNLPSCPAPGSVNQFDLYNEDPNNPVPAGTIVHKAEIGDAQAWFYSGTFFFGGNPFAGMTLVLTTGSDVCPNAGCEVADINGDCEVNLSDLAVQLGNFGNPSDQTKADGDLDGDGDVDLTDLAIMLSAFGTICT